MLTTDIYLLCEPTLDAKSEVVFFMSFSLCFSLSGLCAFREHRFQTSCPHLLMQWLNIEALFAFLRSHL
jgi:hypothetical protein